MVYNRASLTRNFAFNCGVREAEADLIPEDNDNLPQLRASNSLFKTYRLALSCTIEYAAYHVAAAGLSGGTLAHKKAAVLAAMNVTMTRVNGVYEKDMSLTMQLIANNDAVINITSDNLDNNNSAPTYPLLDQNQTFIDATIGNGNYDIGHVATTGAGGVATLGCVCTSATHTKRAQYRQELSP